MSYSYYPRGKTELTVCAEGVRNLNTRAGVEDAILTTLRSLVLAEAEALIAARDALAQADGTMERLQDARDAADNEADAEMMALFAMVKRSGGAAAQRELRSLWGGEALHELLDLDDDTQVQRVDQMLVRASSAGLNLPRERADAVVQSNQALRAASAALGQAERAQSGAASAAREAEGRFSEKYRRFVRYVLALHGEDTALALLPRFTRRSAGSGQASEPTPDSGASSPSPADPAGGTPAA